MAMFIVVYVRVCVCLRVFVHIYTYIFIHLYTYSYAYVWIQVYIYSYPQNHSSVHKCICVGMNTYVFISTPVEQYATDGDAAVRACECESACLHRNIDTFLYMYIFVYLYKYASIYL